MTYNTQKPTDDKTLSVSAAMAQAKSALESFTVKLIGEVSEVNNKAGYKAVYFTVKDEHASLPCMMWLNRYNAAGVDLRAGMLVELSGRFTLYTPKGRMNFDVFSIALAGEGNLRLQVANLAKKLEAEGLMRPERKRLLPSYPQTIGLVTSPRGAAVHDVLRTLRRRFPLAHIKLAGVAVEGEHAAEGLVVALKKLESTGVEVILLVRGGGSFEDLMPFNDEQLARSIAQMSVPVVTGIGHEPDTSIADMVSDFRASTPTAAAEAVSPAPETLSAFFSERKNALSSAMERQIERQKMILAHIESRPLFQDAHMLFSTEAQTLDMCEERLNRAIPLNIKRDIQKLDASAKRLKVYGNSALQRFENAISIKAQRLHDLSPLIILSRGYAIAKDEHGAIVDDIGKVAQGDKINVDISNGRLRCRIEAKEEIEVIDLEVDNG